jgi:hypothetical protein
VTKGTDYGTTNTSSSPITCGGSRDTAQQQQRPSPTSILFFLELFFAVKKFRTAAQTAQWLPDAAVSGIQVHG